MILLNHALKALIGYHTRSSRLVYARFKTNTGKLTVIQVFAPTSDSSDEEIDDFYRDVQRAVSTVKQNDLLVIIRDWKSAETVTHGQM